MEEETLQIRYLIVIAALICAFIIGYNAFYVPEISIPDITVKTDSEPTDEVYIPQSVSSFDNDSNKSDKININTATAQQISERLDGIGDVMSKRIVAYRESCGKFNSINDIKNVNGIGDKTFAKIKNHITV